MPNRTPSPTRIALVTGAFSGIGLASAVRLAQAGWKVYAAGRNLEKGASLAAQNPDVHLLKLDVTDQASITEAIQGIEREVGRLDLLVNNAGFSLSGAVTEVTSEQIRQQFETNVIGPVAITREALPLMCRNRQGRVIFMSSALGKFSLPSYGIYAASKFAIEGLSDALRLEFKLLGPAFHVVLIEPSFIRTGLDEHAVRAEFGSNSQSLYGDYFTTTARLFIHSQISNAPEPDTVARVVVRAANAARPRARYVVSRQAALILTLHRLVPDWAFDYVLVNISGLKKHLAKTGTS